MHFLQSRKQLGIQGSIGFFLLFMLSAGGAFLRHKGNEHLLSPQERLMYNPTMKLNFEHLMTKAEKQDTCIALIVRGELGKKILYQVSSLFI